MNTNIPTDTPALVPEVAPAVAPAEEHHSLGPSKYSNWALCPGWEGKELSGELAERGSAAHELLARILTDGTSVPRPDGMSIDDETAARWAAETLTGCAQGQTIHSEEKALFAPRMEPALPLLRGVFGRVDAWHEDAEGNLHIYDFKTFDRGEKDHTPQMSGYAVLVCSMHPKYAARPIFMHVLAGGIHSLITYRTDFRAAATLVAKIVQRHLDAGAERSPCDACRYCANVQNCPAIDRTVATVRQTTVWNTLSLPAKKVLAEELKKILKSFDDDFEAAMDAAGGVLEDPDLGIRWERRVGNPSATCHDVTGLARELEKHGIPHDQFLNGVVSVSQKSVTEALVAANDGWAKGDAEKVFKPFWIVSPNAKGRTTYKRVS